MNMINSMSMTQMIMMRTTSLCTILTEPNKDNQLKIFIGYLYLTALFNKYISFKESL